MLAFFLDQVKLDEIKVFQSLLSSLFLILNKNKFRTQMKLYNFGKNKWHIEAEIYVKYYVELN